MTDYKAIREEVLTMMSEWSTFENCQVGSYNCFKTGGNAALIVQPGEYEILVKVLEIVKRHGAKYVMTTGGSRILFPDEGFDGVVIKVCEGVDICSFEGDTMTTQAGILLSVLSRTAGFRGKSGLEFIAPLAGGLGDGIVRNVGMFGKTLSDVLISVTSMTEDGKITERPASECGFGPGTSIFKTNGEIVIGAKFQLSSKNYREIEKDTDELVAEAAKIQPAGYAQFFNDPEGKKAAELIEAAGMKGAKVGGAMVSDINAAFIVNAGGAKTADIVELAKQVKEAVKAKCGVELEENVKLVG